MFRIVFRILDIPASIAIILGFSAWWGVIYLRNHFFRPLRETKKRRILFFVAEATYKALKDKGVLHLISEREEGGYFDVVYTIHPFVSQSQTVRISDKNILIEYGTDRHYRLRKSGFKYTTFIFVSWGLLSFANNLIGKENINIIRSTDPYLIGLIGLLCSKLTGKPFCVSVHADYDLQYKAFGEGGGRMIFGSRKPAEAVQRFVLSHSKMVMPISGYVAKYAIRHGAKSETIRVIPHGIDPSLFSLMPGKEQKQDLAIGHRKVVLFVGRLSKDKYPDDVIGIAARVYRKRRDVVFVLVGDGEEKCALEQSCRDLGLENNVRFLGYQPHDRVIQIMLMSDINLCPLSGFALVEAAMSGKPIVAYDVEWHSELIKNNESGFLVEQGDIESAADAIIRLLDEPELSRRLGENARKLAIEKHSLENTSRIKVKCYEELLIG